MTLNFIFAHLNTIALLVWVIFFCVILVRYVRPGWVRDISYRTLLLKAFALHLFYAAFVTWGQYYTWATSSDFTRGLLAAPLPKEAPLWGMLEYMRPLFEGSLGYFAYYAFGRFFLNILVLFLVAGFLYTILKFWNTRQKSFEGDGPELLFILMLIVGWPGVILFVPLAFLVAILFSVVALLFFKKDQISLVPAFLVATPVSLIFGKAILESLNLYTLLAL